MDEEKFAKGFNDGYDLRQDKPALLDKLLKGLQTKNDYIEGLEAGVKQRENELERERIKASIEKGKEHGRSNERDRDR